AVIAYTAEEVYAIAELLRRQRGGAAVVMGALSPRTRNAQVAMFEAGEVDYLVGTDAIGMGLNLNIAHVALASLRKFDGSFFRPLSAAEIGQVAGRAGRHMSDGSFGTTGDAGELAADLVAQVEQHQFAPLERLHYRNSSLDFDSATALIRSLERAPPSDLFARAREAEDVFVLKALVADADIADAARSRARLELLWDVCRVPDFRKTLIDAHVRLLARTYRHLISPARRLPTDWIARQVDHLDRTTGDIDTLARRLADIRTWTYVSHQASWVDDPLHWQERTRGIEDRLSDALHQSLTQRFVDRRTSLLARRLKDSGSLSAAVEDDGKIIVEGHSVGRLKGFRFRSERGSDAHANRMLRGAAERVLGQAISGRALALAAASDEAIRIDDHARLRWRDEAIAQLVRGATALDPEIQVLHEGLLHGRSLSLVRQRLQCWVSDHIRGDLAPLVNLRDAGFAAAPGGIAFRVVEGFGAVKQSDVADLLLGLNVAARRALRAVGLRFGRHYVFLPTLLRPAKAEWCLRLAAIEQAQPLPPLEPLTRVSFESSVPEHRSLYGAAGYRAFGARLIRLDMIERLADAAWAKNEQGPFVSSPELLSLVGCRREELAAILREIGFRVLAGEGEPRFHAKPRRWRRSRPVDGGGRADEPVDPHSPFAALATLKRRGNRTR
ncbi:MAG: hypothetical protein EXQ85_09640, partial [Alphaproteobacteria bacterium]|nr:hypothetical protein [Alphaproteobacteria bacterium]